MGSTRDETMQTFARILDSIKVDHPLRVAIDGVTAAGKSTLASELTRAVSSVAGRPAIHLSTDDFHHQKAHRWRDHDKARGYYRDSYNLDAFRRLVLQPMGPKGDGRYVAQYHDLQSDEILLEKWEAISPNTIVIVDGTFLQSPSLAGNWDVVVWVATSFEVAEDRAAERDAHLFGSEEAIRTAYRQRYHAACRLYIEDHKPLEHADIVFYNDDLQQPSLFQKGDFMA